MRVGSIKVGGNYYMENPLFCRSNVNMILDKKEILYALKVEELIVGRNWDKNPPPQKSDTFISWQMLNSLLVLNLIQSK
jgi:hypothetical protein